MFLRLFPAILSLVVLAAHFARMGNFVVVLLLLACVGLLWMRRPWVAYAIQTLLVLGVIVWILTAAGIALARIQTGESWLRMALILFGVTCFTAYAAWHFRHPRLRAWFGTGGSTAKDPSAEPSAETS